MRWIAVLLVLSVAGCAEAPEEDEPSNAGAGGCTLGGQGGWHPVTTDGWREMPFVVEGADTLVRYKLTWDKQLAGDGGFEIHDPAGAIVLAKNITGGTGGSLSGHVDNPAGGTWTARLDSGTGAASAYTFQVAKYHGAMREGCGF